MIYIAVRENENEEEAHCATYVYFLLTQTRLNLACATRTVKGESKGEQRILPRNDTHS